MYFLARIFPFWSVPFAFLVGEMGRHFRRRQSDLQWYFFGLAGILVVLALLWFAFGGYKYSDEWVKYLLVQN